MCEEYSIKAKSLPYRALVAIRSEGFGAVLRRILRRAWFQKEYTIFLKILEKDTASIEQGDVIFHKMIPADIHWVWPSMTHLGDHPKDLLEQQFINSRDLTTVGVCKKNKRIVFSAWVSLDHIALSLIKPDRMLQDASLRRVWVPEDYRRKGIAGLGVTFTEQQALSAGIKKMWSFVLVDNTASQKLHARLHYRGSGKFLLINRFDKRFGKWKIRGSRRWMRVRLSDEISNL